MSSRPIRIRSIQSNTATFWRVCLCSVFKMSALNSNNTFDGLDEPVRPTPGGRKRRLDKENHKKQQKTYSVTIVTSVPWDTERVLRLVKTHMGKCLFSPELKSYLITQWNCTTIGSCRCRKTNQWVGSGAARTYGDDTRQYSRRNGRGIWLYKRSFRHRILRFTSTEATTESCSYLARQSTQYSFRISGNRGYDSNRVRSLSILHSYCVL